ncbi:MULTISPECIES: YdeI/OmpD-associated family protein [unclassified Aureispira]|uniref:YdeI/OmpD-associated family protein n=1 Tax=unclassified Aureispira TaxID=2649989 RepID=UPI0006977413|nr:MULTISPECIES: YdeI/OmpD-associated family protein [unclassified Aureispira]WMX12962.1 YdeI/OmpD-associated family protein [Aureispira sp. CCB-E]
MIKSHNITAIIQSTSKGGAYIEIPFDVEEAFGAKRPKVSVLFEGQEPYRGTLSRMGTVNHILIVRKDIRNKLNKEVGDHIQASISLDTAPRVVEVPPELQEAFAKAPKAAAFYQQLSYTCQKEYANYINQAKRATTKERRALKTIELLNKEIKTPF